MARPRTIDDQQILDAAREVFLEHGMKASTMRIARAAGVSEGTIFKRFDTKERLFFASLGFGKVLDYEHLANGRVGCGDPREQLVAMCMDIIAFQRELVPRMMMLCSHPKWDPRTFFSDAKDAPPLRAVAAVQAHIEGEQARGRLADSDPSVAARMLISSMHSFAFFEAAGLLTGALADAETHARAVVGVIWRGIGPGRLPR